MRRFVFGQDYRLFLLLLLSRLLALPVFAPLAPSHPVIVFSVEMLLMLSIELILVVGTVLILWTAIGWIMIDGPIRLLLRVPVDLIALGRYFFVPRRTCL